MTHRYLQAPGATDMFGNIRVSPYGSSLERSRVLLHEKLHRFFTPRGPLQISRAKFSMWAYENSHLIAIHRRKPFAEKYRHKITSQGGKGFGKGRVLDWFSPFNRIGITGWKTFGRVNSGSRQALGWNTLLVLPGPHTGPEEVDR